MTPDVTSPFGAFLPPPTYARLLALAQRAPHNVFGKQLARLARGLYLWRAPLPADVTVGELRLRCYLRDNTCERKFVFTPWRFDPQELRAISAALPADGVFVDIGANVGIYTLHAAILMGTGGRVIAFEPYLPAYHRLCFNIGATRVGRMSWPRIDVLPTGVSSRAQSRDLAIDAGNLGGASITGGAARFSRAGAGSSVTIECQSLVEILLELGVTRIDVLKIDIEGAEDEALCPFLATAPDELLPHRLIVENSDHLWKSDLRTALSGRGFVAGQRTRLNTIYTR